MSTVHSCRRPAAASRPTGRSPDRPARPATLRPIIALHGKGQNAAGVMAGGVEQGLAQAVAAGIPPFAVVAVDGGGGYWHNRASGEDSGAMVLERTHPDAGLAGPRHIASRFSRLVDGRLRRIAARRASRRGPHRGHLRGQPGIVDVVRCDGTGCVRRRRRLRGQQRVGPARAGLDSDPDRLRQQRSVLLGDAAVHRPAGRTRPRAASPPADTTAGSGVRSCPPKWPGWRRCWSLKRASRRKVARNCGVSETLVFPS